MLRGLRVARGIARTNRGRERVLGVPRQQHVETQRRGRGTSHVRGLANRIDHAGHGHIEHAADHDRASEHVNAAEEPRRRVAREHDADGLAQGVPVSCDERQIEDVQELGLRRGDEHANELFVGADAGFGIDDLDSREGLDLRELRAQVLGVEAIRRRLRPRADAAVSGFEVGRDDVSPVGVREMPLAAIPIVHNGIGRHESGEAQSEREDVDGGGEWIAAEAAERNREVMVKHRARSLGRNHGAF